MTERFFMILLIAIIFGAVMEQLHRHAPGVAVFVAATLGAQMYIHALAEKTIDKKIKKGELVFRKK